MRYEEITQGNILIAEFLGMQETDIGWYDDEGVICLPTSDNTFDSLEFHSDWNWLMAVVDEIESIVFDNDNSFNVTIGSTIYCVIQDSNGECYDRTYDGEETKLLVVYKAVVEFIKWYNDNKSQ